MGKCGCLQTEGAIAFHPSLHGKPNKLICGADPKHVQWESGGCALGRPSKIPRIWKEASFNQLRPGGLSLASRTGPEALLV